MPGNITNTTFTSLKKASLDDSGNYTLTVVNEYGQNSSQVHVEVLTSKLIDYFRSLLVKHLGACIKAHPVQETYPSRGKET